MPQFRGHLGAGLHIFLVSKAALDLGLRFTSVFTTRYNGHKLDEPRNWVCTI